MQNNNTTFEKTSPVINHNKIDVDDWRVTDEGIHLSVIDDLKVHPIFITHKKAEEWAKHDCRLINFDLNHESYPISYDEFITEFDLIEAKELAKYYLKNPL